VLNRLAAAVPNPKDADTYVDDSGAIGVSGDG